MATASFSRELPACVAVVDVLTSTGDIDSARDVYPFQMVLFYSPPRGKFRCVIRGNITHLSLGCPLNWILAQPNLKRCWLEGYGVVCYVSRFSVFRELVASFSSKIRKFQLIYIVYVEWQSISNVERAYSRFDKWCYSKLDAIGVDGRKNVQCKTRILPLLGHKIKLFHNRIEGIARPHMCILNATKLICLIPLIFLVDVETHLLHNNTTNRYEYEEI